MAILRTFNGVSIRKPGLYGFPPTWIDSQADETVLMLMLLAKTGNKHALELINNSWYRMVCRKEYGQGKDNMGRKWTPEDEVELCHQVINPENS